MTCCDSDVYHYMKLMLALEVHIDIVFEESRKISQHIGIIRSDEGEDEIIQKALNKLRQSVAKK